MSITISAKDSAQLAEHTVRLIDANDLGSEISKHGIGDGGTVRFTRRAPVTIRQKDL